MLFKRVHASAVGWLLTAAIIVIPVLGPISAAAADITADPSAVGSPGVHLLLNGDIRAGDADKLKTLALSAQPAEHGLRWLFVSLNSDGGSVTEAMKIGRFLRSEDAEVRTFINFPSFEERKALLAWANGSASAPLPDSTKDRAKLPNDGVCNSSCVLIFIAGVVHSPPDRGELGIHRPYLIDGEIGQDFERSYRDLRRTLEDYFKEMHISLTLLDFMYSIPPDKMHVLNLKEKELYIPMVDPVFEEMETTVLAKMYGLSNLEYRQRIALAYESCGEIGPIYDLICHEAKLWGISKSEYSSRGALARNRCAAGRIINSSGNATARQNACVIEVMRGAP